MAIPEPIGKQKEVVCLDVTGHHVVLGTAGSGKTTMAVARAKYLVNPMLPGNGRTLIITFNKTLMKYIRSIAGQLSTKIDVENYHHFARGYLNHRGLMSDHSITSTDARCQLIDQAVADVAKRYKEHAFFKRAPKFFHDEIKWLAGQNLASVEKYVEVRRAGRADAQLSKQMRPVMWEIRMRYFELRAEAGRIYDLDDIAVAVSAEFSNDHGLRMYQHVVIDEGQDLSPEMLRSLTKAIPINGSVTFFGDVAQQIYGRGMSFRDAGLKAKKVWEFTQNYRNTRSIARLGLAISKMPYYADETDMVEPVSPTADGPKPTLVKLAETKRECSFIAKLATEQSKTRRVAILLRTHACIRQILPYLPNGASRLREDMNQWNSDAGLFYGTYHSAKGLEFDVVLLPFLKDGVMPSDDDIQTNGEEEAFATDGRLLYVGVTRAKTELILTYTDNQTRLIPPNTELYTVINNA